MIIVFLNMFSHWDKFKPKLNIKKIKANDKAEYAKILL